MRTWATIGKALREHGRCALVSVLRVEGSAPREAGARLVVVPRGFYGTIGGGALEWRAIAQAQAMLECGPAVKVTAHALGPDLGQCCGGRVRLLSEVFGRESLAEVQALAEAEEEGEFSTESVIGEDGVARRILPSPLAKEGGAKRRMRGRLGREDHRVDSRRELPHPASLRAATFRREGGREEVFTETFGENLRPLYLFGAGHVGRTLVLALAALPFEITWIDPRPDAFPAAVPGNVTPVRLDDPARALETAPADCFVLIMTHSHALDLAICAAALGDARFPHVGLIGSASKRARFERRLREGGIDPTRIAGLVCPIGIAGIASKTPAAIAASVAAQLLQRHEALQAAGEPVAISTGPAIVASGGRG